MAEYEMRPDTGSTFKNLKKTSDTHAGYTGTALVGGVEYWLNTFVKKDKNGNPWFSHSFKVKQPRQETSSHPVAKPDDDLDSLPF